MISMETWGRGPSGAWPPAPSLAVSAPNLRGGWGRRGPGGAALNYCSRVPGRGCGKSPSYSFSGPRAVQTSHCTW